jgi:hypothetical protein
MTQYRVISEIGEGWNLVDGKYTQGYHTETYFLGSEDDCIDYIYKNTDVMIDEDFTSLRDGGEVNGYMIDEVESVQEETEFDNDNDDAQYEEAFDASHRKGIFA